MKTAAENDDSASEKKYMRPRVVNSSASHQVIQLKNWNDSCLIMLYTTPCSQFFYSAPCYFVSQCIYTKDFCTIIRRLSGAVVSALRTGLGFLCRDRTGF
ncbi:hypothetical protein BsWGS_13826 [Bradybaena similaris]